MPALVIVESPAKAKTIGAFLGKGYRVEASYGHVRDLPAGKKNVPDKYKGEKWAEYGVNVENDFEPIYVVADGKQKQINILKAALKDATELLLATDEDREGESISWHLVEVLKPKVPVSRIVFHEITREAIKAALEHPRAVDVSLVRAQESRRILDRLFGYRLSPVLWRKVQPGLSAGRVQSVAVRLIAEREEERRRFVSSEYWDLEAMIGAPGTSFRATLVSLDGKRLAIGKDFDPHTGKLANEKVYLLDGEKSAALATRLEKVLPWTVKGVEEKPASQRPYPPFTTSTLQQEANRKLGFGSKRTMQIAQKLYEGVDLGGGERVGLITYMRTDSVTLSDRALREAQETIRGIYGKEYAEGPRPYKTKARNAQEAHEAIRPTELARRPADVARYLDKEELAVYELVWKRTIASQMPDARLLRTGVEIAATSAEGKEAIFTASGKRILFPGFLRAYVEGSDDPAAEIGDQEVILPDLKPDQKIMAPATANKSRDLFLDKLDRKKHETTPPARYTEASLVKKLEEEGIGRPSTYASIISTIQDRGYVYLSKSKQLVPTFTAMVVTTLLRDHFPEYVDLKFTARMEEELDQIADGSLNWVAQLGAFYNGTPGVPGLAQLVESKAKSIDFPVIDLGVDPGTGEPVRVRVGKFGPYVARGESGKGTLADIPADMAPEELDLARALELLKNKQDGPRVVGVDPASGQNIYATIGRYGAYVQLGESPEDPKDKKAPKPKRASLEQGQTPDSLSLDQALALLSFPRELGTHPETGEVVIANKGRFGPYVQLGGEFRSLKKDDEPETVTLERALELLAQPKQLRGRGGEKTVLKEIGADKDGNKVQVLDGKYGAYVTDGTRNATLPDGTTAEEITMERAVALLDERGKSKGKKKAPARRAPAKAPAKKAAKKK